MAPYKYVIVGGGIAGGKACEGIRQIDATGEIALVTQEPFRPYERPPLSKKYLRGEAGLDKVFLQPPEYYSDQKVDLLQDMKVKSLDPQKHRVVLDNKDVLEYEKLLLATGGRARRLSMEGSQLGNVYTLRTITDSDEIRRQVIPGNRVLVMGGSFIGAEAAASLAQMGAVVTQIFPGGYLFEKIMPEQVANWIQSIFEQHGVRLAPGVTASRLEGGRAVEWARLDNGEVVDTSMVIMGVGIDLNTELAAQAGLKLQEHDRAVIVNENLRSSDPDIYAAGDIAAWPDPTFDTRMRVEHWDVARRQGLLAGRNMAGAGEPYTALPNFFSDLFDLSFDVWGNLAAWDQAVIRGSMGARSFAVFYFNEGRMTGALVMGRSKEEQKQIQALIRDRPAYDDTAQGLADESRDLGQLEASVKAGAGH